MRGAAPFLSAWIGAWAAAFFSDAAFVAFSREEFGPGEVFAIADAIPPEAKLTLGGLLLLGLAGLWRLTASRPGLRRIGALAVPGLALGATLLIPTGYADAAPAGLVGRLASALLAGLVCMASARRGNRA